MDDKLKAILASTDPSEAIEAAVTNSGLLRLLNQNVFSSQFSGYVARRSVGWNSATAEVALRLAAERNGARASTDMLLELAFHASLAFVGEDKFSRNMHEVESVMERLEMEGPSCSSRYVQGLIAYAKDDLLAAERAFVSLPDLADLPMLAYQAGYPAFRAPPFLRALLATELDLQLDLIQRPARIGNEAVVLLCSVDDLYLAAFGEEFIRQAMTVSTDVHVHLHLINNRIDPAKLVPAAALSNERISISVEETELSKPEWYAAMSRYIVLPLVMSLYQRPVLVTDIDVTLRSNPAVLNGQHAVSLEFSRGSASAYVPTCTIQAGHALFQPTDPALEFASILSRYLHQVTQDPRGVWIADQVALLMVWRMLGKLIRVGDFKGQAGYVWGSSPERPVKKEQAAERLKNLAC